MASIIKANQLQDFGGNSIIGSDGAGNLTTQKTNYPAFLAYASSSQTLTDNTTTKVQFNSEFYDTDNPRKLLMRVRRFFKRSGIDVMETNIFRGLFSAIQKKLNK